MHLAHPRKQARTWRTLILATALLSLAGCSTTEPAKPDQNLPTTKAETLETMNTHLRLVLDGIMAYQTATTPPERAPLGTIQRVGCVQGNKDYLEGPPWKYVFTTGDTYTPEKDRLLTERINDLTEVGWRITRSPDTDVRKRWAIVQDQGFAVTITRPRERELAERPPEELYFVVAVTSPCVDVVDNDR